MYCGVIHCIPFNFSSSHPTGPLLSMDTHVPLLPQRAGPLSSCSPRPTLAPSWPASLSGASVANQDAAGMELAKVVSLAPAVALAQAACAHEQRRKMRGGEERRS